MMHQELLETQRDAAQSKDVLADVIPALERASGLKAEEFPVPSASAFSQNEWSALWLARAILEKP